jgi:hypothetical protein
MKQVKILTECTADELEYSINLFLDSLAKSGLGTSKCEFHYQFDRPYYSCMIVYYK